MTNRFSLALIFVGALGLGMFWVQRANEAKMQALQHEVRRLSDATDQANTSAERTERVVPALVNQILAGAKQPETAAVPPSAPPEPADPPADFETRMEEAHQAKLKEAAYIDSVYARQAVDAKWAQPTQAAIRDQLVKQLGTSTLESLDCRESLCKARLGHQDVAASGGFVDRLVASANDVWKGQLSFYRDPVVDGRSVGMSIYFAKVGTTLPAPQP